MVIYSNTGIQKLLKDLQTSITVVFMKFS